MSKVKYNSLKDKSEPDLLKQVHELKTELANLRLVGVTRGAASKLKKIRVLRKSIARVYTYINTQHKLKQREAYKGKHYCPKDLKPKKTRAIRRKLTRSELNHRTSKLKRKQRAFPKRIFAVKV